MRKDKIVYDFAKEFTEAPGPRYASLGDFSGQTFREEVLKKLLDKYDKVEIDGSGIKTSFSPSFLSEAFGSLAVEMGKDVLLDRVRLYSKTNDKLEEKFRQYVSVGV